MSITQALEVFSVEMSIGEVLQESLKLSQIDLFDHFIDIDVHYISPVDPARSLLETEFRRRRHQVRGEKIVLGVCHGGYETSCCWTMHSLRHSLRMPSWV